MVTTEDTISASDVNYLVTAEVTAGRYVPLMDVRGTTPGERIAFARKARGLTQEQLAELIGTTKQTISRLEAGDRAVSAEKASRIGRALAVSPELLLFGNREARGIQQSSQPRVDSRTVEVVELDVRAAAGPGLENGDHTSEVARWAVPRALMEGVTTASPDRIRVITVYGDSMEPTLAPGTRVMVDTEDRIPSPPGIFVVFDGLGLVCKRVEPRPLSSPPSVRLISDNPRYESYECPLEEAHIQGRVIGRWQWT
jgi:transcriptional regulator with XRE-family HTH domain